MRRAFPSHGVIGCWFVWPLQWRHNGCGGISNHRRFDCFLNRLFRQIKENIKAPHHWPLWGESTGHRWIPLTKGQLRGKCFHLMTSSWLKNYPFPSPDSPIPCGCAVWSTKGYSKCPLKKLLLSAHRGRFRWRSQVVLSAASLCLVGMQSCACLCWVPPQGWYTQGAGEGWDLAKTRWNKQRVLMHRHQGWNVRHGLCHIYMRYLYIYMSCL